MAKITFGIFDHIEGIPGTPTRQLLHDRLNIIKKADAAGFAGFYVAEHHGTDLCLVPNQDLIIAAASQVTATIRMGPMVKLLPLHNPVRVIEDLCVLDNLTGGRVEFGVGRGIAPVEHYWFGGDWLTSRDRYRDALGIVARALRTGEISSEDSKYYKFRTMPMACMPVQENIPFWCPNNPAAAGRYGFKLMSAGPITRQGYDLYLENWHTHRDDPIRFDGPGDEPFVGVTMPIAIDYDEKIAHDQVTRAMTGLMRRTHAVHDWDVELIGEDAAYDALAALRRVMSAMDSKIEDGHGTPSKIIDRFGKLIDDGMVDQIVLQTPTGDITIEEANATLELFISEVQPALEAA